MSDPHVYMIFEEVDGQPIPRLPRAKDGTPREADAKRYFSLDQAAARFHQSDRELRRLWCVVMEDFLQRDFSNVLLEPDEEAAAPIDPETARLLEMSDDDILYRMKFNHISRENYDFFMTVCRRRMNPWATDVYARMDHDRHTGKASLLIIVGINGLRRIANSVAPYIFDPCVFEYGEDQRIPIKATFTIYKFVGGVKVPCSASVLWDECAPAAGTDWFWDERPHDALELRAEAKTLRAFSDVMGDLYTPDEVRRNDPPQGGGALRRPAKPALAATTNQEDGGGDGTPTSRMQFELRLIEDMEIKDQRRRDRIIGELKTRFTAMFNADERLFWQKAWQEMRRRPQLYDAGMA